MNNLNELRYWKHIGNNFIPIHTTHLTQTLPASYIIQTGCTPLITVGTVHRWRLGRPLLDALVFETWWRYMKTRCSEWVQQSPALRLMKVNYDSSRAHQKWQGHLRSFPIHAIPDNGQASLSHQRNPGREPAINPKIPLCRRGFFKNYLSQLAFNLMNSLLAKISHVFHLEI